MVSFLVMFLEEDNHSKIDRAPGSTQHWAAPDIKNIFLTTTTTKTTTAIQQDRKKGETWFCAEFLEPGKAQYAICGYKSQYFQLGHYKPGGIGTRL